MLKHISEIRTPLYFIKIIGTDFFLHFEMLHGPIPTYVMKKGRVGAAAWTKDAGLEFLKKFHYSNIELVSADDEIKTELPQA